MIDQSQETIKVEEQTIDEKSVKEKVEEPNAIARSLDKDSDKELTDFKPPTSPQSGVKVISSEVVGKLDISVDEDFSD